MIKKAALGLSISLLTSQAAASDWLHCGNLFDSQAGELRGEHYIEVDGGLIKRVTRDQPDGAEIIDLSDKTCLPGLIDLHVHLDGQSGPQSYMNRFTEGPADLALTAQNYGMKTLMAGFTTVRNPGDSYNVTIALRDAINAGTVQGPRIYSAGKSLATTGGHADPTNGVKHDLMGRPGPTEGVINSPADAKEAVRQHYKEGADFIKITATGGVLSMASSGENPQFTQDELETLIDIANDYNFHVAAHAHGKEGMLRAVKAGVKTVEHGTYMDDEVIAAMKENGTYLVPTILAGKFVAEKAKIDGYFPEVVRPKAAEIGPLIQQTFAKAYKAGVNIAFGTDSGVSAHGDNALEFEYMVEAGMPAAEAIQTATTVAAEILKNDKLGEIAAGKYADIIAVDGDPLADVKVLQDVDFVMKNGEVVKR
ncbi:amidohydrolase [Idiomarina sp. OT37-5b]|mgnify:CR=1 FL=1|jgi:imidazolonepropionase-like amidohydrolase|uniref:Amidohydrolase n=1 Tax=Idiomarina aquatica TaxID=1327752 RepID=A0AA94JD90_9GAMM|nr:MULTISPECIES: amidohydrolase family protein [Idiomarina]AVJ57009.1 amidohydrolase [Idiomarina sp. OT37-5b]RUO40256.1 amidohydrolase [Idiomarina aquatica]